MNEILKYASNEFLSITNIKQVKSFTLKYPADVPEKYIFYTIECLLSLVTSKHIKRISNPK